jgi:acetyl-CoA carboxylase biotin carboxyl carrier protein
MAKVAAHITGTVVTIEKQPGEAVKAGETLVVLESMKMEMPLESPVSGTVKEVRCAPGQAVNEGDVLAVVE